WTLRSGFPSAGPIAREIATSRPRSVVFDVRDLGAWDSALVTCLRHLDALCASHQVAMRRDALPVGVQRLLALAEAVPEKPGVRRTSVHTPWIARLGTTALDLGAGSVSAVAFVGEVASATWRLMRRSARLRIGDLAAVVQEGGARPGASEGSPRRRGGSCGARRAFGSATWPSSWRSAACRRCRS